MLQRPARRAKLPARTWARVPRVLLNLVNSLLDPREVIGARRLCKYWAVSRPCPSRLWIANPKMDPRAFDAVDKSYVRHLVLGLVRNREGTFSLKSKPEAFPNLQCCRVESQFSCELKTLVAALSEVTCSLDLALSLGPKNEFSPWTQLTSIETLCLHRTQWQRTELVLLERLPNLTKLALSGCYQVEMPEPNATAFPRLNHFTLDGCNLECLSNVSLNMRHIAKLRVFCGTTRAVGGAAVNSFSHPETIRDLTLYEIPKMEEPCPFTNLRRLHYQALWNWALEIRQDSVLFLQLTHLYLCNDDLRTLTPLPNLRVLALGLYGFCDEAQLATWIRGCANLTSLALRDDHNTSGETSAVKSSLVLLASCAPFVKNLCLLSTSQLAHFDARGFGHLRNLVLPLTTNVQIDDKNVNLMRWNKQSPSSHIDKMFSL